ncbi:hypothetical protein AAG570_011823 [Ranatra chinensis]|uniref:Uncharacterized protein n=1 Tax=Ranatra chinensis TaxID=642074 RepID=A0ABD0YH50_9HEMI
MASKRRNMFQKNKTQETTENGRCSSFKRRRKNKKIEHRLMCSSVFEIHKLAPYLNKPVVAYSNSILGLKSVITTIKQPVDTERGSGWDVKMQISSANVAICVASCAFICKAGTPLGHPFCPLWLGNTRYIGGHPTKMHLQAVRLIFYSPVKVSSLVALKSSSSTDGANEPKGGKDDANEPERSENYVNEPEDSTGDGNGAGCSTDYVTKAEGSTERNRDDVTEAEGSTGDGNGAGCSTDYVTKAEGSTGDGNGAGCNTDDVNQPESNKDDGNEAETSRDNLNEQNGQLGRVGRRRQACRGPEVVLGPAAGGARVQVVLAIRGRYPTSVTRATQQVPSADYSEDAAEINSQLVETYEPEVISRQNVYERDAILLPTLPYSPDLAPFPNEEVKETVEKWLPEGSLHPAFAWSLSVGSPAGRCLWESTDGVLTGNVHANEEGCRLSLKMLATWEAKRWNPHSSLRETQHFYMDHLVGSVLE